MKQLEVPDRGYAWMIVFCAGLINAIISGLSRMIGLLYVAILEEYAVPRREASVPFTVRNAVRYLTGPLVGVLGQRFGIRSVTFAGGVIAATGSILCAFAPNVTWIIFIWGGIHGLGFSMCNTLFQVVVNQYFEHHRATASGLVLSGACIGSFIFPFLINAMLDAYGLFGCFLLLGGIFLNVLPPSMGLKSPPWIQDPEGYAKKKILYDNYKASKPNTSLLNSRKHLNTEIHQLKMACSSNRNCNISHIGMQNECWMEPDCDLVSGRNGKFKLNENTRKSSKQTEPICTLYSITETYHLEITSNFEAYSKATFTEFKPKDKNTTSGAGGKCETIKADKINMETRSQHILDSNQNVTILKEIKSILLLYTNSVYVLISVSMATYFWLFLPVMTVVVDYTRDKGISLSNEKYLIHAMTVGDLIGRLGLGWVTDRQFLSLHFFMTLLFSLQGAFAAMFPLTTSLLPYMTVVALYGVTAGAIFAHFPILVHRYVDQKHQSIGIGCIGMVSAMLTFKIPDLIGHFRDNVGSYDGMFYILGSVSAINGIVWLFVPLLEKKQSKAPNKS